MASEGGLQEARPSDVCNLHLCFSKDKWRMCDHPRFVSTPPAGPHSRVRRARAPKSRTSCRRERQHVTPGSCRRLPGRSQPASTLDPKIKASSDPPTRFLSCHDPQTIPRASDLERRVIRWRRRAWNPMPTPEGVRARGPYEGTAEPRSRLPPAPRGPSPSRSPDPGPARSKPKLPPRPRSRSLEAPRSRSSKARCRLVLHCD